MVDWMVEIHSLVASVKHLIFPGEEKSLEKKENLLGFLSIQPMSSYGRSRVTHQRIQWNNMCLKIYTCPGNHFYTHLKGPELNVI